VIGRLGFAREINSFGSSTSSFVICAYPQIDLHLTGLDQQHYLVYPTHKVGNKIDEFLKAYEHFYREDHRPNICSCLYLNLQKASFYDAYRMDNKIVIHYLLYNTPPTHWRAKKIWKA
jgi:hypothetical protein